ncbi:hypothetical protein WKU26_12055 [Phocaeicola sp. HCN-40430]|uniref:hypothetical protein n=1 Tax=Phocaeicola sp. HCN-40430 TaxID=3134664 RepID=UPI0030C15478
MKELTLEETSKKEYANMFFFLTLCGNVFCTVYISSLIYVFTAIFFLFIYLTKKSVRNRISNNSLKSILLIVACFLSLFFVQYLVFGWNTVPGIINHISKFIIGAGYISYLGDKFRIIFFKTMYIICLIALPLWIFQQIFGGIPGLDYSIGKTIWIYSYREGTDIMRNCGFFWEPGAFGGYIAFLTLLFFNDLAELFKTNKWKCIVIIATLLSTQSTGGYMSFGTIIIMYLAFSMKSKVKYIILPLTITGALYAYSNLTFLSEKFKEQNSKASEQEWGEYSSTRMGTFMFDLYYITKHPFIGNGLHERTRLADHPILAELLKNKEIAGAGNGFSDTLVKWGVIYAFIFGLVFIKTNKNLPLSSKICFLLLICFILQGEPFMNFPLFLGIPLIKI